MAAKWTNRLQFEAKDHDPEKTLFVTLTYDEENLPANADLNKRDLTLYKKRLRKRIGSYRHFSIGEYGDKSFRPHYHLIIFGVRKDCNRSVCRFNPDHCDCVFYKAWKKGRIEVEMVRSSKKGMKYVTGYCFKKRTKEGDKYLKGHTPEFKTQSTKPPLGQPYILRRFEHLKRNYGHLYEGSPDSVQIGKRVVPLDRHLKRKVHEQFFGNTDNLDRSFKNFAWENFAFSYDETGKTRFDKNSVDIQKDKRSQIEEKRRKFRKKRRLD